MASAEAWKVICSSENDTLIQSFTCILMARNESRYGSLSLNHDDTPLVNAPEVSFSMENSGKAVRSRFSKDE